jgi:hypothetical protein
MNRKFYFSLLAFALTVSATVAFVVGHNTGTRAASTNGALAALPASDFVITIDAQRALNETLPGLLAGNPELLAKMNAHLEKFEKETGINPRSFESVAIGGRLTSSRPHDSRAVVIASGSFNSDSLLENAFAAVRAKGENFRKEEQVYEGRRIILITPPEKKKAATTTTSGEQSRPAASGKGDKDVDYRIAAADRRMAIAVLDARTLAIGDLDGVRAAVDATLGRNAVDGDLIKMATQTPGAVVGFSGKLPQSFAGKAAPNSTIEKYFASVRQFYGSFGMSGTDAETVVAVRTETAEQASDIGQALNTLKTLSAFGFSRSSGGDPAKKDSLADLIKGLSITTQGNEVQLSVRIPQGSIAPLMRTLR